MPDASRDGVRLYYEQDGHGDPPLLFVHGWCCDHTFFAPQYEHFKSAHSVTALDLRGCGRSDQPDDGYDIPALADDLAWFCDEIGISQPVVIGHSLGGMLGIELAAKYPTLPRAVIAVDPGPIDMLPEARVEFEEFDVALAGSDREAARRAWVEETAGPTVSDEQRRLIVETMCAVPVTLAAAVIRGIIAWDGKAAFTSCRVPVLVLRSWPGGSNEPARLLAMKPDVEIGMTVGAGHFHQLEVPEQVNAMIARFLRSLA